MGLWGCMGTDMRARGGLPAEAALCAPAAAACRAAEAECWESKEDGKERGFTSRGGMEE
jgi:hypothetical protein